MQNKNQSEEFLESFKNSIKDFTFNDYSIEVMLTTYTQALKKKGIINRKLCLK